MHILKKIFPILLLVSLIFPSCSSRGPLTPEEAFYKLRYYVKSSKTSDFIALLSKTSIDKINMTKELFSKMSEDQLKLLSEKYEMPGDKLKNLSIENYIKIYFLHGRKNDIITRAIESDVLSVNVIKERAKITMDNGHFLFFVKEGPYWKFEMSEL